MSKNILEIKHYTKIYSDNKKAVDDLNITVKSGEIHAFIGHNGAGKTTTIRAVVGVMDFEEGEILIDGHSVKKEPVLCKSLTAYIPDNPDLYEYITGVQYLNYICDMFSVSESERISEIRKYAELFKITDSLGDLISSYSHGMKQKLVIISALIHEPKLLILDEPFVGLDPKASKLLKDIMKELCQKGTMIFFSSHVLEVVEKLCDHIGIIKNGKLIECGETDKIKGKEGLENVFLELTNEK